MAAHSRLKRWMGRQLGILTKILYKNQPLDMVVSHISSPLHVIYFSGSIFSLWTGFTVSRDLRLHNLLDGVGLSYEGRLRSKISIFLLGVLGGCYLLGRMCREPLRLASIRLARVTSPVQSQLATEERHTYRTSLEKHLCGDVMFLVLEYLGDTEAEIQQIAIGQIIQDKEQSQSKIAEKLQALSTLCDNAILDIWNLLRLSLR